MKKTRLISCLLILLLSVWNMNIALGEESTSVHSIPKSSDGENADEAYAVNLAVEGGILRLFVPKCYQLQAYELSDIETYPHSYVFVDEDTRSQFIVYSALDSEKDQGILLRKLYDKSNRFIIFENVVIGEQTYLIYTREQDLYSYGFIVCAEKGYSYRFQYILPDDSTPNGIPADAVSILSTVEIQNPTDRAN